MLDRLKTHDLRPLLVVGVIVVVVATLAAVRPFGEPQDKPTGRPDRVGPNELFVGEMSGFTFFEYGKDDLALLPEWCKPSEGLAVGYGAATKAEVAASPLEFAPRELGAGTTEAQFAATKCAGRVMTVERHYALPGSRYLVVSREDLPPNIIASYRRNEIQPWTIKGRRAILIDDKPTYVAVLVEDGQGRWAFELSSRDKNQPATLDVAIGFANFLIPAKTP